MSRVRAAVASANGHVPDELLEAMRELEQKANEAAARNEAHAAADNFEFLLRDNPTEEQIHSFIVGHPFVFGHRNRYHVTDHMAQGLLSKFPITVDRIPDFTSVSVYLKHDQRPNQICVWELKRPNVQLFSSHARMSKDLNDAWMEGVESLRLIAFNYLDFVRRAIKTVRANNNSTVPETELPSYPLPDYYRPRCRVRIIIGRRSALSPEDLMRVRELAYTTNFSISIATYDSLLDDLRQIEHGEANYWGW